MNILIIGATGSLGRTLTKELLETTDYNLTLFSRSASKLKNSTRVNVVEGNIMDEKILMQVVKDKDLVFVALSGDLPTMARKITEAMKKVASERIVFVSSYGIYREIAGRSEINPILIPYREAADIVEQSGLTYTILRPGWFDNSEDLSCNVTIKGETIYGHDISRKAIANFVISLIKNPTIYINESCGLTR